MRTLPLLLLLLTALAVAAPVQSEETFSESVTSKAQPLLKALSMIGTPYKFGSNNPEKGLDCSGFVKHVYKESADISLPRSARDMSKEGQAVAKEELEPGDLVFFNTRKRPNSHVGIYAGNGEFVHASSNRSKQVTVSRMDQQYWATRFNGARRVLASHLPIQ
jgi:cell wall-associated NlpC family hydrolase